MVLRQGELLESALRVSREGATLRGMEVQVRAIYLRDAFFQVRMQREILLDEFRRFVEAPDVRQLAPVFAGCLVELMPGEGREVFGFHGARKRGGGGRG